MAYRTDLAAEAAEGEKPSEEWHEAGAVFSRLILSEDKAAQIGKVAGNYLTVALPHPTSCAMDDEAVAAAIGRELASLLPPTGCVLVVGLGNQAITPDALGPKTVEQVLATRHIHGELAHRLGLERLRSVALLAPGVLGNTGMESEEIVAGVCREIRPAAVVAVDALAACSLSRLGCTVQIADTGIAPGSGVGNRRRALNRQSLGVPVVAVGIPTVVDAATVVRDLTGEYAETAASMMVTPREVDAMIDGAAHLLALSLHAALQPSYSPTELTVLA